MPKTITGEKRGDEMTEFTSELISTCREEAKVLEDDGYKAFTLALDHIERLQDLMLAYENDLVLLSVYGKLKRAEAEIKESNDLLRSAWMIAKRDGNETNWEAWRKQLDIALARQHTMMYGDSEQALNEVEKC